MKHRALFVVALCACANPANDLASAFQDAFESLALEEPIEAEVAATRAADNAILGGVFLETQETPDGQVSLNIETQNGGRVSTFGGVSAAAFEPLTSFIGPGAQRFELPSLSASTSLALIAWNDKNSNGKLDIDDNGELEPAFGLHRDYKGTDYVLSSYSYDAASDAFSATAVSATYENWVLTKDDLKGWTVTIDE